jgi:hypothetical protein
MPDQTIPTTVDQRSPDQDTAIEQAFLAGTLPEEDRRTPEEKAADLALAAANPILTATTAPIGADAAPGSITPLAAVGPAGEPGDPSTDLKPVAIPIAPTVPFPHDTGTPHALDNQPEGTVITKDSATTIAIAGPNGADGGSIPAGDALHLLPVGSTIVVGAPGTASAVLLTVPASDGIPIASFGARLHDAMANLWRWIVTEASE